MITFKQFTHCSKSINPQFFVFYSQTDVVYSVRTFVEFTLSKSDLIDCINFLLSRLDKLGLGTSVVRDYKFEDYEYHELSFYLYELLVFYSSKLGLSFNEELRVTSHSRLSIVSHSSKSKEFLFVEVAKVRDNVRGCYRYLSYVDSYSYCSDTLDNLLDDIRSTDPLLAKKYDIRLTTP